MISLTTKFFYRHVGDIRSLQKLKKYTSKTSQRSKERFKISSQIFRHQDKRPVKRHNKTQRPNCFNENCTPQHTFRTQVHIIFIIESRPANFQQNFVDTRSILKPTTINRNDRRYRDSARHCTLFHIDLYD